ncbi:DUF4241 domain-containing protein [Nocardia flavorosea]|uniref:DUF4241 domain-containing protein n=1 Tax=Nocardia flavorosea TaxID=53429 RepID=A0A846YDX7_9NOCA|nr:DUF4241 domain-containing protein [Nocardia flavorosea]NKY55934.1 DUF4241 domain-containing protein [Nocardia flavorosea]
MKWKAVYCEGWDSSSQRLVGQLHPDEAQRRDRVDEQYSVVLSVGDTPRIVIDIAWSQYYLALWTLDDMARRDTLTEFRRLEPNRLFTIAEHRWLYPADQREGEQGVEHKSSEFSVDGWRTVHQRWPDGSAQHSSGQEDVFGQWREAPVFGDWSWAVPEHADSSPVVVIDAPQAHDPTTVPAPWRPPTPLQPPPYLDSLMAEGTEFVHENDLLTTEYRRLGSISLPSGQVVAFEPAWSGNRAQPFTAQAFPGRYPVFAISILDARQTDAERRQQYLDYLSALADRFGSSIEKVEAALPPKSGEAYILQISEDEVTDWEPALRPGEDIRVLGDGQYYGFSVDGGQGCFTSPEALPLLDEAAQDFGTWSTQMLACMYAEPKVEFPLGEGLDLVPYHCPLGDGSYPTWVGRNEGGAVVCFVTDMLTLALRNR